MTGLRLASAKNARPQSHGSRSRFRTDVQGLRALAVGLVLVYRAGIPPVTQGMSA